MGRTLSGMSARGSAGRAQATAMATVADAGGAARSTGSAGSRCPSRIALAAEHDRRDLGAEDPEQARHRDRHEERLFPAEGGQVVERQRGEGERHEHLKGAALKCSFLDPVDLEDRQEERQVNEVAQEQPQAAPAGLGLARIKARVGPVPGSRAVFGHGRYCWWSARSGPCATELRVSAPMGAPPLPAHPIHGRRAVMPRFGRLTRASSCRGQTARFPSRSQPVQPASYSNPLSGQRAGHRRLERSGWQDARRGGLEVASGSIESAGPGSSVNR